ncbi:MAG: hypothetical protein A2910_01980 [Candidatus Yanofskybacteria bacterium RIFCSPLOWO2_01_FULL_39_28]|nr:MAG: hypothetical protein A2910_01980 [Candidatus Yanofskybacteria bacterium RIFCSPLOWO2_01_FULL_39_28]
MKYKKLAIFGIITYILQVISSAQNSGGEYTMPPILIIVSGLASLTFMILAVVYLWKTQKLTSSLYLIFTLISLINYSPFIRIVNFVIFLWVISLLWAMAKYEKLSQNSEKNTNINLK